MNARRLVTTRPALTAVVVTSAVRPECLDGIVFTSQSENSVSVGRRFGPRLTETPARETRQKMASPSSDAVSPSAPNLSGFPGTGAVLICLAGCRSARRRRQERQYGKRNMHFQHAA